jgi:hypothetical protein
MNERIRELAEQAQFNDLAFDKWGDAYDVKRLDPEKFAELIVRECAELIDNKEMITAAQTYDEVFVAKYDTKELCANQIREHFGVQE